MQEALRLWNVSFSEPLCDSALDPVGGAARMESASISVQRLSPLGVPQLLDLYHDNAPQRWPCNDLCGAKIWFMACWSKGLGPKQWLRSMEMLEKLRTRIRGVAGSRVKKSNAVVENVDQIMKMTTRGRLRSCRNPSLYVVELQLKRLKPSKTSLMSIKAVGTRKIRSTVL